MPIGRQRDALKPFMRPWLILALIMALATLPASASPSLTVGGAQLLYSDAQLPFTMDGSFATLKRDSTTMYFWHTDFGSGTPNSKWFGPLNNPLQTNVWFKTQDEMWSNPPAGQLWLVNIYQISGNTLLGFVHREFPHAVGLGYSTNGGDNWIYLGDIILPQDPNRIVGGVPYLVVGPYFYAYYNEGGSGGVHSVARAPVANVLTAAANGTVTTWQKYLGNGNWNSSALSGVGADILPDLPFTFRADTHSDAAHSTALNKYMLLSNTDADGYLIMYLSDDGLNWPAADAIVVDQTTQTGPDGITYTQHYSTIASLDPGASNDSREVGASFTIYYPYKSGPPFYAVDQLFRRQVTVGSAPPPAAPRSLQLSSLLRTACQRLTAWLATALALVSPAPAEAVTFWTEDFQNHLNSGTGAADP